MRRLFPLLILLLIVCVFLISCTPKDEIYIKGNIEETIEVYTEFIDPGVSYPKNYTLVVEGNIDNTILEKQHIKYFVYSPDGELIKELHRFVNVVDSTPPTYFENININDNEYYVGKNYNLFDFISNYEDNYVNPNSITVEPVDFSFKTAGEQEIIINFIDTFGNKSTFSKHINVVIDHTPPSYIEDKDIDKTIFYTGTIYYANDFISHYEDNYDSIEDIKVTPSQFVFTNQGVQEISIVFLDTWGNKSTFTKKILVDQLVIDFNELIRDAYKNQSYKIYSGTTGNNSKYITVRIDEKTSFSYYDSGSLHYIQTVTTKLGKRASIQISSKYGNFNNASISFHISGYGTDYSVGFATIDITKETIAIDYFRSTINNLNLNEAEMLKELNDNILSVLNNFKDYMHYTFNLALY